jgi:hypothetical protein
MFFRGVAAALDVLGPTLAMLANNKAFPLREVKPAGPEAMPAAMKRELLETIHNLKPDAHVTSISPDYARGAYAMADNISVFIRSCPDTGE